METKEIMVQQLLQCQHYTQWKDIFTWYPQTRLARYMGINSGRFKRFVKDPGELKIDDILYIADFFGVDYDPLLKLIFAQMLADRRYRIFTCINRQRGR